MRRKSARKAEKEGPSRASHSGLASPVTNQALPTAGRSRAGLKGGAQGGRVGRQAWQGVWEASEPAGGAGRAQAGSRTSKPPPHRPSARISPVRFMAAQMSWASGVDSPPQAKPALSRARMPIQGAAAGTPDRRTRWVAGYW